MRHNYIGAQSWWGCSLQATADGQQATAKNSAVLLAINEVQGDRPEDYARRPLSTEEALNLAAALVHLATLPVRRHTKVASTFHNDRFQCERHHDGMIILRLVDTVAKPGHLASLQLLCTDAIEIAAALSAKANELIAGLIDADTEVLGEIDEADGTQLIIQRRGNVYEGLRRSDDGESLVQPAMNSDSAIRYLSHQLHGAHYRITQLNRLTPRC